MVLKKNEPSLPTPEVSFRVVSWSHSIRELLISQVPKPVLWFPFKNCVKHQGPPGQIRNEGKRSGGGGRFGTGDGSAPPAFLEIHHLDEELTSRAIGGEDVVPKFYVHELDAGVKDFPPHGCCRCVVALPPGKEGVQKNPDGFIIDILSQNRVFLILIFSFFSIHRVSRPSGSDLPLWPLSDSSLHLR